VRQWIGQVMQVPPARWGCRSAAAGGRSDGESADDQPDKCPGGPTVSRAGGPRPPAGSGGPGIGGAAPVAPMMADPAFEEAQQAMERDDLDGGRPRPSRRGPLAKLAPATRAAAHGPGPGSNLIRRVSGYDQAQVRRAAGRKTRPTSNAQSSVAGHRGGHRPDRGGLQTGLLGTVRRTSADETSGRRARVHLIGLFDVIPAR